MRARRSTDPVPPRHGGFDPVLASIVIVVAALGTLGVPGMIVAVAVVACYWAYRALQRWLGTSIAWLVIGVLLAVCHVNGYRVFGRTYIHDNRPLLDGPYVLARIEPPNVLVAADGSRHEVAGLHLLPVLAEFSAEELPAALLYGARIRSPVRFLPSEDERGAYVFEHRIRHSYSSGAELFPRRLESHVVRDLVYHLDALQLRRDGSDERSSSSLRDVVRRTR